MKFNAVYLSMSKRRAMRLHDLVPGPHQMRISASQKTLHEGNNFFQVFVIKNNFALKQMEVVW